MINPQLFEFAEIYCANDYIMAKEDRNESNVIKYIENNNLRIENLVFNPKTNQIRFMLLPCQANKNITEVFNITNPSIALLRRFWNLSIPELRNIIAEYANKGDLKNKYKNSKAKDRGWLISIIHNKNNNNNKNMKN